MFRNSLRASFNLTEVGPLQFLSCHLHEHDHTCYAMLFVKVHMLLGSEGGSKGRKDIVRKAMIPSMIASSFFDKTLYDCFLLRTMETNR